MSGTAAEGQVVSADAGRWRGSKPALAFQWRVCEVAEDADNLQCADVPGATDSIYAIGSSDVAKALRVVVSAASRSGTASAVSPPTAAVVAAPPEAPRASRPPALAGTPQQDQVLGVDPGTWIARSQVGFSYRWRLCDPRGGNCSFNGATGRTYRVRALDVGKTFRVLVSGRSGSLVASALTAPTAVVAAAPSVPRIASPPRISGKAQAGQTLTAASGNWRGTQPITFAFQWQRCDGGGRDCQTIPGATRQIFNLENEDVGHRLRVLVAAANQFGRASAASSPTGVVQAPAQQPQPPRNVAPPTIGGAAMEGVTLTAAPGSWQGTQPISFSYQWYRCLADGRTCGAIPGATRQIFMLEREDVGRRLVVRVTARNTAGASAANSAPTAVVQSAAPPPPPPPPPPNFIPVAQVSLPNQLVVDQIRFTPSRITSRGTPLTAQFHVSDTQRGRSVVGALVYAVGVPFNRLSSAPETTTGQDGWATITFRVLPTFALRRGNLVVVFVRARKPGENALVGVSTRRLVSVRVG